MNCFKYFWNLYWMTAKGHQLMQGFPWAQDRDWASVPGRTKLSLSSSDWILVCLSCSTAQQFASSHSIPPSKGNLTILSVTSNPDIPFSFLLEESILSRECRHSQLSAKDLPSFSPVNCSRLQRRMSYQQASLSGLDCWPGEWSMTTRLYRTTGVLQFNGSW